METIEIRVSEGTATLMATRGISLHADQIDRAVKSAGFTPRGMVATAVGTVWTRGEARFLRWDGSEIELVDDNHVAFEDAQKVRLTGVLTVHREGTTTSLAMTVNELEVVES